MKGINNILTTLFCIGILLSACGTEPKVNVETLEDVSDVQVVEQEDFPEKVINPIPSNTTVKAVSETSKAILADAKEVVKEDVKETIAKTKKVSPEKKKEVAKKKPVKKKKPRIKFDTEVFEFGTIKPGDVIDHKFEFTNTGDADLVIKGADVTCGCTHPSYPFVPIAPGERGFIGVTYDSKGKLGRQKPTVTLTTNAGTKKIAMEGYVISEMAKEE